MICTGVCTVLACLSCFFLGEYFGDIDRAIYGCLVEGCGNRRDAKCSLELCKFHCDACKDETGGGDG